MLAEVLPSALFTSCMVSPVYFIFFARKSAKRVFKNILNTFLNQRKKSQEGLKVVACRV
jgi:hypothetical protein